MQSRVDTEEMPDKELSHLDLHCLHNTIHLYLELKEQTTNSNFE